MLSPPACSTRPPSGAHRLQRESNTNAMRLSTAASSNAASAAQQQTFAASAADPRQTAAVQRACDVSQATGTLRDASGEKARPLQGTNNKAKSTTVTAFCTGKAKSIFLDWNMLAFPWKCINAACDTQKLLVTTNARQHG